MENNINARNESPTQEASLDDPNYISNVYSKMMSYGTFTQEDEDYLKKLRQLSPEERDVERVEAQAAGDIRRQNLIRLDSIERSVDMQMEDGTREAKYAVKMYSGGHDTNSSY